MADDEVTRCDLCSSVAESNLFRSSNGVVACLTCVLGYKAVLEMLEKQPHSGSITDVGLLARLIELPCFVQDHQHWGAAPLWAVCPPCHARRCLRILHPLDPCFSLPQWLKRRARLVTFEAVNRLNDLWPALTIEKVCWFYRICPLCAFLHISALIIECAIFVDVPKPLSISRLLDCGSSVACILFHKQTILTDCNQPFGWAYARNTVLLNGQERTQ